MLSKNSVTKIQQAVILGCLSSLLSTLPALGAEQISFSSPLGELTISISSLEEYARSGKIDRELAFYTQFTTPSEFEQLRELLKARIDLGSVTISQFFYSSMGEIALKGLGEYVRNDSFQNGFYALRSALILSAVDKNSLNLIDVLKKFPSRSIRIDSNAVFNIYGAFTQLVEKTKQANSLVQEKSEIEASKIAQNQLDLPKLADNKWQKQTLKLNDKKRKRAFVADLYLPKLSQRASVVVISHGFGSDRTDFVYLAEHLASHGFAVAVVEHPGSNTSNLETFIRGATREAVEANEFINRPKDVSFLLDYLQQLNQSDSVFQNRFNLEKVGAIGHSFGGYTVMALAGAKINIPFIKQQCRADNFNLNVANASYLLLCITQKLNQKSIPNLQDKRIQAVFAINPVSGGVFGETGLLPVKIPVMFAASSNDAVAPALLEQICPFTWLNTPNKYLALTQNATHSDANQNSMRSILPFTPEIASPNPKLARSYYKYLTLAFAKTYIAGKLQYSNYLAPSYARKLSQPSMPLKILRELTSEQLSKALNFSCPGAMEK
jgi:predicted dienelactone hydrolase